MVEGESQLYQVALWPSHESYGICRQSTQTIKKKTSCLMSTGYSRDLVVEYLPTKHETLGFVSSIEEKGVKNGWCPWPVPPPWLGWHLWPVLRQRAMLSSMAWPVTREHADVCGTCWCWWPCESPWSMLPLTEGQGSYFCNSYRFTIEKEGHRRLLSQPPAPPHLTPPHPQNVRT